MKTTLVLLALLIFASASPASEVEVRLVKLTGGNASDAELVRLCQSGQLPNTVSFTAKVGRKGAVTYSDTKPLTYPIDFSPEGKALDTQTTRVGLTFSGRVESIEKRQFHRIDLQLDSTELQSTHLYPGKKGVVFPQPVFSTHKITTSVGPLLTNSWGVISFGADAKGVRQVCLIRVRE